MSRRTVIVIYSCICLLLYFTSHRDTEYQPFYGCTAGAALQVESMPDIRENGTFYVCKLLSFKGEKTNFSGRIRLYVKGEKGTFSYGDILQSNILLTEPDVARNPGNFNDKRYLLTVNIGAVATVSSATMITRLQTGKPDFFTNIRIRCKKAMTQALQRSMPNGGSAFTEAVFLGEKDGLAPELTDAFGLAGISHFMAVSGAHAVFFLMPFSFFMQRLGMKKQRRYVVEILLLFGYVAIADFGIPIVRAGIMMSMKRLAFLVKRDYDPVIALLFSLSVLMAYNPYVIYSSSMQLSFGAVLSMLWIQPAIRKGLSSFRLSAYLPRRILDGICVTVSVQLGILPILINQFQMPSVFTVFTNLICAPIIEGIMLGSIAIILFSFLRLFFLARWLGYAVQLLGVAVTKTAEYFAMLSKLQTWRIIYLEPWQIVIYYVLLAGVVWVSHLGLKRCLSGMLCIFLLLCSIQWPAGRLQITCIDVGQGDCIYMQTPTGHHYLIDCGSGTVGKIGKQRILPYLKTKKGLRLSGIFLSHYDNDHISGLQEILESCTVNCLFLPAKETKSEKENTVLQLARTYGTEVCYWKQGDNITDGAVSIQCLHPFGQQEEQEENAISMVLKVSYQQFDALFTGDLPLEEENKILDSVGNCDMLKVGHHGAATSTGEVFLKRVQPRIALISCGEYNPYGHPHKDVLKRLEDEQCQIYSTKDSGALTVTTNGENIVVTKFL